MHHRKKLTCECCNGSTLLFRWVVIEITTTRRPHKRTCSNAARLPSSAERRAAYSARIRSACVCRHRDRRRQQPKEGKMSQLTKLRKPLFLSSSQSLPLLLHGVAALFGVNSAANNSTTPTLDVTTQQKRSNSRRQAAWGN
jgi:hypothetical protein